ncbi:MAG: GTPase HflX [Oscillospiraceae bacterium]|nr:GTPase HflX [Clostridiaceae bacterium]MDY5889219.1 GTPase HflX [Oscillospiraceae bacterium]MDY5933913.1 GTPase HflX [Oscillospiraceae bacterium]
MEFFENSVEPEVAVLVGIDTGLYDAEVSMDELEELARTAGAVVAAKIIQKRDKPDTATYVGSGRLEEIKDFTEANDVDLLIFDGELTPSQQRNIEDETDVRVIDRTTLILDIFAARARSNEGKIQVELAQLKYSLPRLGGKGTQMSRLGGGIGTRGPGESKLESDRRHIRRRIQSLQEELVQIAKRRENLRTRREKDGVETVAIVGYTNAGKSTLMNTLTNAGVLAENKLFATLDPTSRALTLPDGRTVMLIDTVGLVRRLPHQLVDAFRSTLEEAANATVILNICDASDEHCTEHLNVTMNLLAALGCADKPIISVLNKCDLCGGSFVLPAQGEFVMISAKTGEGLGNLLAKIQLSLPLTRKKAELLIPYSDGGLVNYIREEGVMLKEDYRPDGIYVKAVVDVRFLEKHRDMIIG